MPSTPERNDPYTALRCRVEVNFCVTNTGSKRMVVFGETLASLCLSVQKTKSLYAAAEESGLSYSQAWRKIQLAESILEEKLFERHGNHGSVLSPLGEMLLETYLSLNENLSKQANEMFCTFENNHNSE